MSEVESLKQTIESLSTQLEASKQMYNDAINNCFQLKTANIQFQIQINKLNQLINKQEKPDAVDKEC
jgi:hypothetical protein